MAATAVNGPPPSKARPRSTLDTIFDVLGNAVARFDSLTGARINARDVNSKVMPLGREAMRVANQSKYSN